LALADYVCHVPQLDPHGGISIDGNGNETAWGDTSFKLVYPSHGVYGTLSGPEDAAVKVWLKWDSTYLYAKFDVTDNESFYECDGEFDTFWLWLSPDYASVAIDASRPYFGDSGRVVMVNRCYPSGHVGFMDNDYPAGAYLGMPHNPNPDARRLDSVGIGYGVSFDFNGGEIRIDLGKWLQISPNAGDTIGFACTFYEGDNDHSHDLLSWTVKDPQWNSGAWGMLTIDSAATGPGIAARRPVALAPSGLDIQFLPGLHSSFLVTVPEPGPYTLRVYDLSGSLVYSRQQMAVETSQQTVQWPGAGTRHGILVAVVEQWGKKTCATVPSGR
jgi:hypothetical protein